MATVVCDTCGVKPELPEWMRGWFTIREKSWCPEHRHSVRVGEELAAFYGREPDAMDALLHARRVQLGTATQLELEV